MMNLNYLKVISTLILLFFIASSCSTIKKMALSCPEPASHYKSKTSLNHPRHNETLYAVSHRDSKRSYSLSKPINQSNKKQNNSVNTAGLHNKHQSSPASTDSDNVTATDKIDYKTNLYAAIDNSIVTIEETNLPTSVAKDEVADFSSGGTVYERPEIIVIVHSDYIIPDLKYSGTLQSSSPQQSAITQAQDTLYLKDGSKVAGKLVGKSKKEYRLQSSDGMVFIFSTDYVEKFVPAIAGESPTHQDKETNGVAIAGFVTVLLGLIGAFIPEYGILIVPICGLVGLVLSIIALRIIKKYPEKYKISNRWSNP